MTHDDLVIWAYENASDLIKMAGFAPRAIDLTDEATRSNIRTQYAAAIRNQQWQDAFDEVDRLYKASGYISVDLPKDVDKYLPRLRAKLQARHWGSREADDVCALLAKRMQEWPSDCCQPSELKWPAQPEEWFEVKDRSLELPIKRDGGRRFIDLAVTVANLGVTFSETDAVAIRPTSQSRLFFEIKPTIRRLDELLQQCRIYREGRDCNGLAVISPDTRYKRIIEEQGFPFIVPTIGQQSLGF